MAFKIGFTAETGHENKRTIENTPVQKEAPIIKKSVAITKNEYPFIDRNDYLAAVSKTSFFEFVIDGNTKGTFTMG